MARATKPSGTRYQYLSVMRAKNDAGRIEEGSVHIMNGKKDDGHVDRLFNEENEVVAANYDLLEHLALPERMTLEEAHQWVRQEKEDYLVEKYGSDSPDDSQQE